MDVASVLIFLVGWYEILNNSITVGEYLMISNYFSMLLKCTSFFMNLGKSYQDTMVSFGRLQEIKEMKSEENGYIRISNTKSIEIKNLNFSYDEYKIILSSFKYKFMKGNVYFISVIDEIKKDKIIFMITHNKKLMGISDEVINSRDFIQYNTIYDLKVWQMKIADTAYDIVEVGIVKNKYFYPLWSGKGTEGICYS